MILPPWHGSPPPPPPPPPRRAQILFFLLTIGLRVPVVVCSYLRKGNALIAMKRESEAETAFTDALKLDPNNAEAKQGYQSARGQKFAEQANMTDQERVNNAMKGRFQPHTRTRTRTHNHACAPCYQPPTLTGCLMINLARVPVHTLPHP